MQYSWFSEKSEKCTGCVSRAPAEMKWKVFRQAGGRVVGRTPAGQVLCRLGRRQSQAGRQRAQMDFTSARHAEKKWSKQRDTPFRRSSVCHKSSSSAVQHHDRGWPCWTSAPAAVCSSRAPSPAYTHSWALFCILFPHQANRRALNSIKKWPNAPLQATQSLIRKRSADEVIERV